MESKAAVLVTGVSTGIGWSTAKVLLNKGFQVFGTVRKPADAERLSRDFGAHFTPLLLDVTDDAAIRKGVEQVASALGNNRLFGLVNNAGLAVAGPLLEIPLEDVRRQMEVNLLGPLRMIQAFGPLLGTDPRSVGAPGRIVQISSVGGKVGFPFIGPYVASKHALEGLSEVLRRELLLYGIDVIVIGPGSVKTAMADKAEELDLSSYRQSRYAPMLAKLQQLFVMELRRGLPPDTIGELVYKALTARRPKVRYAIVPQKLKNWTLPRLLPKRFVDRAVGKQLGLL